MHCRVFAILLLLFLWLSPCLTAAETPLGNFPLVNQEGKPFQLHDFKGKNLFISFVFSRCPLPKMCPLTMTLNKRLLKAWKGAGSAPPLHFLVVTLDPGFDTPSVLKKYGKAHNVDWKHFTLATGNPQVLSDFASQFNVIGIPSEGSISHNMKNILVGPDMVTIKEYKDNEWTAEQVLKDIKSAVGRRRTS